jgi:hypothetical protein
VLKIGNIVEKFQGTKGIKELEAVVKLGRRFGSGSRIGDRQRAREANAAAERTTMANVVGFSIVARLNWTRWVVSVSEGFLCRGRAVLR